MTISAALADQPIAGLNASLSMMTKGGLNTVTRSLAIEYAKEGIRFNAVAPGVVDTALHRDGPSSVKARQPMGKIADVKDIVEAVLYLLKQVRSPERCCTSMVVPTRAVGSSAAG